MNPKTFSLVVPTYNRRELAMETIQSALQQTTSFNEIIVVDDGSTDGTAGAISRLEHPIRTISSDRAGVQVARNIGVESSNCEWIVLCDSDDLLDPRYLERTRRRLEENPNLDAAYSNFSTFSSTQTLLKNKFESAPSEYFEVLTAIPGGYLCHGAIAALNLLVYQPLFPSGLCIKKRIYQAIGGFDPALRGVGSEDLEFTIRLVASAQVAMLSEPYVRIRKHGSNQSGSLFRQLTGEAQIIRLIAETHSWAEGYRPRLTKVAEQRSLDALRVAFQARNWEGVRRMQPYISAEQRSYRDIARVAIANSGRPFQWLVGKFLDCRGVIQQRRVP